MLQTNSNSSHFDVLIVGAGPAGLALANWFRHSSLRILLVDKKPGPTPRGQAEGLKSTTCEIFESFGIGPQIWGEAWRLEEIAIWGAAPLNGSHTQGIVRERVLADCVPELSKPREVMLQQARVEHHLLQNLFASDNIEVQYGKQPTKLFIDRTDINDELSNGKAAHPVTAIVASASDTNRDLTEEIHAKYVIGCDGAHSWTRSQLGIKLEGDSSDSVFGVVDIVPKTNFPDIRKTCYLRASTGTVLIVPRPNKEVRLYVPVESGTSLSDPKDLSFGRIIEAAREIFTPYTIEAASCSWWSAYRVGQRVGERFSVCERGFLVGDAVHTHSPKAGQGMNTSIQDSYNLGWKLRLVLEGYASPALLHTYESERRPVAQDLISFDRGYLKLFSGYSSSFEDEFQQGQKFTTGLSIRYSPSCIVQQDLWSPWPQSSQSNGSTSVKANLVVGKRLPDFQMVCQADAVPTRIHQRLYANGSFRLLVFAGDISPKTKALERLRVLGFCLEDLLCGLGKLTRAGSMMSTKDCIEQKSLVEPILVHCAPREAVELLELPKIFIPWCDSTGYDYSRVYADCETAHDGHGRVYERLRLDDRGCIVVVRPDGHVGAFVREFAKLKDYFAFLDAGQWWWEPKSSPETSD